MTHSIFIRCPGCQTVVDPLLAVCPGCGLCLQCGDKRGEKIRNCPNCDLPYCDCCGRCPGCLELRYSKMGPCGCGHPNDESQRQKLVQEFAIGVDSGPSAFGEFFPAMIVLALIIGAVVGLIIWLQ